MSDAYEDPPRSQFNDNDLMQIGYVAVANQARRERADRAKSSVDEAVTAMTYGVLPMPSHPAALWRELGDAEQHAGSTERQLYAMCSDLLRPKSGD